jgi:hypothetical protein
MFFPFMILLLLDGAVGVMVYFAWRRVTEHLRNNPEAARLVAEHVIAPLLTGKTDKSEVKPEAKPEPKKIKGATLV